MADEKQAAANPKAQAAAAERAAAKQRHIDVTEGPEAVRLMGRPRSAEARAHEPPARTTHQLFHDTTPEIPPRVPTEEPTTWVVYESGDLGMGEFFTTVVGDGITVTLQRGVPMKVTSTLADLLKSQAEEHEERREDLGGSVLAPTYTIRNAEPDEPGSRVGLPEAMGTKGSGPSY